MSEQGFDFHFYVEFLSFIVLACHMMFVLDKCSLQMCEVEHLRRLLATSW